MREMIGPLIKEEELPAYLERTELLITVGDMVTETCLRLGRGPDIAVIDGKTRRGPFGDIDLADYEKVWVSNPDTMITEELWSAIETALKGGRTAINVIGEEDLASLPAILMSPDGALVLYGVPGKGIAVVEVGEAEKRRVIAVLDAFNCLDGSGERDLACYL